MNYIGSKSSLLYFLEKSILNIVNDSDLSFCDLFAGTGVVGTHFKKLNFQIISNDIQHYSYILNKHYIENNESLKFENLFDLIPELESININQRKTYLFNYLENIKYYKGFIYKNYTVEGTHKSDFIRQFFSAENAKKCDAIRNTIKKWKRKNLITENEYFFLLASLINSIDKCANTASVYASFLKKLKRSAQRPFKFRPLEVIKNNKNNIVYNQDTSKLIKKISGDILYLDPPYNERQYGLNYHLLETISKYDNPEIKGLAGIRNYKSQKSKFCSRKWAEGAFEDLIENSNFKYIFLSYNNEGLLSHDKIKEIMSKKGKYGFFTTEHSRYKSNSDEKINLKDEKNTTEYLHYVIVKQA